MDFSLDMDHDILRESVRKFAEKEIRPVAAELDKREEFSYETMAKMAELGLFGVFVSEEYGGQAMDYQSYIIATEEIARVDGSHAATDITAGVTVLCRTGTREDGKPELSCILVESGTDGLTAREMHDKMMWRASNTSELYFEDCRVPKENLLGERGQGFHQMMQTLDGGRLSIGAMGLGGAQGCFDLAMKYGHERVQFGRPIARFQVNSFKLADMATEIEAARLLLYKACWLRDNDLPFSKQAAMAKLYCSEVMYRCANHAVQLHGGYGLMKEYEVERFYRDQKLLEIGEGTSEVQRIVIARHLGALKKMS